MKRTRYSFFRVVVAVLFCIFSITSPFRFDYTASANGEVFRTQIDTSHRPFVWPVPDSNKVSTCYNEPGYVGGQHCAVDIPAPAGTPIVAAASGVVVDAKGGCPHNYPLLEDSCNGSCGNRVGIKHNINGETIWTVYMHMTDIYVSVGQEVAQGTVIGTVGCTGPSTGNHLDFSIRTNDLWTKNASDKRDPGKYVQLPSELLFVGTTSCCIEWLSEITTTPGPFDSNEPLASSISITGESYPTGNRDPGKNFGVYGQIYSNYPLNRVWGGVYYYYSGEATPQWFEVYPNSTYYNLYPYFDSKIIFDDLPVGSYIYRIEASDSQGYSKTLVESTFTVGNAIQSSISISDEVYPAKEHPLGKNQWVSGNISSANPLVRVWGGVYYADGTPTAQYRDKSFNSKYVSLSESFDADIIFGSLPLGDYIYKFDATDNVGFSKEVIRYSFSVVDTLGSDISISGEKYPSGNLPLGGNFGIYGNITSTYPLVRVWGGVYNWDGSPTEQICDAAPNWAKFDIYEKFDPYVIFGALPEGDFIYKIEATDSKGYSKVLINSNFTIGNGTPSSISISGAKYPSGTHLLGKNFGIYGVISSTLPLTRVWGGVYNADGTPTAQYCDQNANSTSFDLYENFDPLIIFDDLPVGDYIYNIDASDKKGYSQKLIESSFSVVKPEPVYSGDYEKGIDVSEFQGAIDWNAVAESGIQFAVIRAATTNFSNAEYMEDKSFRSNYENAKKAGIKVGAYIYSSANTQEEIEQNINSLMNTLDGRSLDLPVFIDVEQASRQTEIGKDALTNVILYGCTLIQNAGYQAGVYANQDWYTNYIDADVLRDNNVTIWLAAWPYTNSPADPLCYDYSDQCTVWQYSDKGLVAGISGYVDLDFSYHIYESIQQNKTGDVNGDDSVDMKDVTLMRQKLADWDVTINEQYADVNGDGSFDMKDVTILRRYLANWDVTLA